jgi:hypothetical protein
MLAIRLFVVLLQMSFFFEAIPEELDGSEVSGEPTKCYIRPIPWAKVHREEA